MPIGKIIMTKYSKNKLLSNIDYLLKTRDIKIGELESSISVSPGYFSRIRNNESDETCPSIDCLSSIACKLKVSLISLLYSDFSLLTETECFLLKSIEMIIKKTNSDQIIWKKESSNSFLNSGFPLCEPGEVILGIKKRHFKSLFNGCHCDINGFVLSFTFERQSYYLIPLADDEGSSTQYELYFLQSGVLVKKVCNANKASKDGFLEIFKTLYLSAIESANKIRIDESVKSSLEDLLK